MHQRTLIGIVVMTLATYATPLQAQVTLPLIPTELEFASLPRECRSRLAEKKSPQLKAEWETYTARHGPAVWDHYHHYCFALNFMNRTPLARLKKDKLFNLKGAINNFNYVLRHWPPNAPLRPLAEAGKRRAEFMTKLL